MTPIPGINVSQVDGPREAVFVMAKVLGVMCTPPVEGLGTTYTTADECVLLLLFVMLLLLLLLLLDNSLGVMPIPGTELCKVDGTREAILWSRMYSVLGVPHPSKSLVQQIRRPADVYCGCCRC
ncbi:MAG: hypothetical protein ABJ056_02790 [Halioglobus sp.]